MPASDIALLTDAARAAGDIASRYWREDPKVWDKAEGAGPVTEADLEVDGYLRDTLMAERPEYGWLSEETEDDAARLDAESVFIVDPIDGTRSFVAGEKTWAHSLAVARNGQVTAAVVYLPLRDKMYEAEIGQGASLNGVPLRVSDRDLEDGAAVLAPRPSLDPAHWPGGVPSIDRHFRPSLAYRLSLVAEGRFDAMITLRDTWEWDVAAGTLIATEAGAQVSDRHGDAPRFNNPHPALRGLIVAGAGLHPGLLRRLTRGAA